MKKIKFIMIHVLLIVFTISSKKSISDIATILVVIEERENEAILAEQTLVAEGIIDALWQNENIIFFDMKIDYPIKFKNNNLDALSFIEIAAGSGADTILLIKIDYTVDKIKTGINLKAKEYYYNLYSLYNLESFKAGKKPLDINKKMDAGEKIETLKQIGIKIINEVFE